MSLEADRHGGTHFFVLVAPLQVSNSLAHVEVSTVEDNTHNLDDTGAFVLLSRRAYHPEELQQAWRLLPNIESDDGVRRSWVVSVKKDAFLVVECARDFEFTHVDEIETVLSRVAENVCRQQPGLAGHSPIWVNRTLLLQSADGEPPAGWICRDFVSKRLDDDLEHPMDAVIGWGNNTVTGWDIEHHTAVQDETMMGLVDAQFLWNELRIAARETSNIAHSVLGRTERLNRRDFLHQLRALGRMEDTVALHRLNYDDLLMNIQGTRHDVARGCLQAWGYNQIFDRVTARLPIVKDLTQRELARLSSRYQGAVQTILTVVAVITIVDFIVGLYSLSLVGTNSVPSDVSATLNMLRRSSADVILILGAVSMSLVLGLQWRGRGIKR